MNNEPTTRTTLDVNLHERKGLEHLSAQTWDGIAHAGIVVVPDEGFRDEPGPVFPQGTVDFLAYLRDHAPQGTNVEIAAEDAGYKEVALHFDVVRLATLFVEYAGAPIVTSLIATYLWEHLGSRFKTAEARTSIVVHREEAGVSQTVRISYEGPATGVEQALKDAIATMAATPGQPLVSPPVMPKELASGKQPPKKKGKRKK